jgi:SSS family solute:Na+ symporter
MAIAVAPLVAWKVPTIILLAAGIMTFYTLVGGIRAVVWTGVLQSGVLIAGVILCAAVLVRRIDGGLVEVIDRGWADNKFSLGSFGASTTEATFWVTFLFGLVTHISNFGIDQSYIQRYLTARSNAQARLSIWLTTLMYVPVAGVFFLIGTGLYVFYQQQPQLLGGAAGDSVFPHFIATQLPIGAGGLVVAAIVAASMDSNLNSMATLTLCDIYKPYFRPHAGDRESLLILRTSTMAWGALSAGVSLAMVNAPSVLDAWWQLSSIFSGGVLGLFLLGLFSRKATNAAAAIGVTMGLLVILWMTLPQLVTMPDRLRAPFHANLTMVLGTLTIFLVGLAVSKLTSRSGGS